MKHMLKRTICERLGISGQRPVPRSKLGIALATVGELPINGLRHPATLETNGWFLWCGSELSEAADFFSPLHVEHLADHLPRAVPYLDLPPGYRFLLGKDGYEDVWFDPELLKE